MEYESNYHDNGIIVKCPKCGHTEIVGEKDFNNGGLECDNCIDSMRFCYADPPYLGCGKKFYGKLHPEAHIWDDPQTHQDLITKLCDEYTDGWAMSLGSTTLHTILPMCPSDVRVMAWVKPFASFKANVTVAYTWEPVIVRGGRKRLRKQDTIRDYVAANITLKKGLTGAKPEQFSYWIFRVLNMMPQDEFIDMFSGTGGVMDAWEKFKREPELQFH